MVLVGFVFLLTSACATIVGEKTQLISVKSTPEQADIVITDEKGIAVFKGETPTTVTLDKSDGSYFGGKTYSLKISKTGYETHAVQIDSKVNGWYIGGNLIFGGLIGYLIVDPLTGAMYKLTPNEVNENLQQKTTQNTLSDDSISVVLLQDVPETLRGKMVPLN